MASVVSGGVSKGGAPGFGSSRGAFSASDAIFRTKAGLAFAAFTSMFALSVAFEPPFLCIKSKDPIQADRLSYTRAVAVSLAGAAIVLGLPRVIAASGRGQGLSSND